LKARCRVADAVKTRGNGFYFTYQESYTETLPEAYEALLLRCTAGRCHFIYAGEPDRSCVKVVMPYIGRLGKKNSPTGNWNSIRQEAGGPNGCNALLGSRNASEWFRLPFHQDVKLLRCLPSVLR